MKLFGATQLEDILESDDIDELTQVNIAICNRIAELAKQKENEHKNIIVRVAGYSDYFVNLDKTLQDEIIHRTEHGEM